MTSRTRSYTVRLAALGLLTASLLLLSASPVAGAITPVDWRAVGAVTAVKDQGSIDCNPSWAFAAVAAIEGAHMLAGGPLIRLSEQQLVSCSADQGAQGCDGTVPIAFQSVIDAGGIESEAAYPFVGCWQGAGALCSTLGDDIAPWLPDQDIYIFTGSQGDTVKIDLLANGGTGSDALLLLRSKPLAPPLFRADWGPLPGQVLGVLPAAGTYYVVVAEGLPVPHTAPYTGGYCLATEGLADGLKPTASVEQSAFEPACTSAACQVDPSQFVAGITGFVQVTPGSEAALQAAVIVAPVAVRLNIGDNGAFCTPFALYTSGILNTTACDDTVVQWAAIVGMQTTAGADYYIVKNSWGTSWGQTGYIWIEAGSNVLGIADHAYQPTGAY